MGQGATAWCLLLYTRGSVSPSLTGSRAKAWRIRIHAEALLTGGRAKAWCLLVHAEASLTLARIVGYSFRRSLSFSCRCSVPTPTPPNASLLQQAEKAEKADVDAAIKAGWSSLTPGGPRFDRAWSQRLKLKYVVLVSTLAFNFNLRRYAKALKDLKVGRCGLTL